MRRTRLSYPKARRGTTRPQRPKSGNGGGSNPASSRRYRRSTSRRTGY